MTTPYRTPLGIGILLTLIGCANPHPAKSASTVPTCDISVVVLGTAQDAGKPQISVHTDPAWTDPSQAKLASSLGLINRVDGTRYLFDATPDIRRQAYDLDQLDDGRGFALDGIFLTHGHMGHYLGLAHLGREAMGAKSVPVYAMPKMASFLRENGPWDQLVALKNIDIRSLEDGRDMALGSMLTVTPFSVPHRGEYTETVGYRISGPGRSAIYLPDIDSWQEWEAQNGSLETLVLANDYLFLDATFYSGAELPGRDMSLIPHPTISTTMEKLAHLPAEQRGKVIFIHLNHSNPAHDPKSEPSQTIDRKGFSVARARSRYCLDE